MRKDVTVFFACNDPDTGDFADQAVQVNVSMGFDDMDLELDCGGGVAFTQLDGAFRISSPHLQDQECLLLDRQLVLERIPDAVWRVSAFGSPARTPWLEVHRLHPWALG